MERYVHRYGGVLYARLVAAVLLAVFMLIGLPLIASAAMSGVVVSELMWDGDEYIELHNLLDEDVSIAGWLLTRQQVDGDIKTITIFDEEVVLGPGAFFLIEKKESATNIVADLIVSRLTLVNGGELITLIDNSGVVIDQVNWLGGWWAGENTAVGVSMERSDFLGDGGSRDSWHTSTGDLGGRLGTPGQANSERVQNKMPEAVIDVVAEANVNEVVAFYGEDSFDPEEDKLSFIWSFGDGESAAGENVTHQYSKVGSYDVVLTVSDGGLENKAQRVITVTKPTYSDDLVINEVLVNPVGADAEGEFIELRNLGSSEIDLSGWSLDDEENGGSKPYVLAEGESIGGLAIKVFDRSATGIMLNNNGDDVRFIDPVGVVRSEFSYGASVPEGQSFNEVDGEYVLSTTITKGESNVITALALEEVEEEEVDDVNEEDIVGTVAGESIITIELKDIRDHEVGTMIKTTGIVSVPPGVFGDKILYLAGSGAQVYFSRAEFPNLKLGDEISITGEISSNRGETRIKLAQASDIEMMVSQDPPQPHVIETGDVDEASEGFLVTVQGHVTSTSGNIFYIDDGSGEAKIYIKDTTHIEKPKMKKGMAVTITGVVSETSSGFRVLPRFQEDVRIGLVAGLTRFPATGLRSGLSQSYGPQAGLIGLIIIIVYLLRAGVAHREPLWFR